MKRRHFLSALGLGVGAPMLLPLFQSILRAEEGKTLPRRFVIFVEGNGLEAQALLTQPIKDAIKGAGGSLQRYAYTGYKHSAPLEVSDAQIGTGSALGALKGGNGEVSLEDKAALLFGLSSKVTGGGHATHTGALSSTRHRKVGPGGPTIESLLSQAADIKGNCPFEAVRIGVENGSAAVVYDICAFAQNKPAPLIINPTAAFNVLFGSVSRGMGHKVFVEKNDLLEFTRRDIDRAMKALPGSSPERQKLEDYIESVEALLTRQSQIEAMEQTLASVKPSEPEDEPAYDSADPFERMRAQTDLAIAALKGGLTQVVVISMGAANTHGFSMGYPSLLSTYPGGKMMAGHDMRHGAEHGNTNCIDVLHGVTRAYVTEMARMARALHASPELGQDGTMLDHTAMLYMSSNGEKHHSNAEEWPMLMLGGSKLGFKTDGRAIVYPRNGDAHRQASNVFNTLGHAAGLDLNEFGEEGPKRVAAGPLSELWG